MRFKNRQAAGRDLAKVLAKYRGTNAMVLALPRGGVVVGAEVARLLELPLDLVIPRKIGHPSNPEYAVCAVSEHGDLVCNEAERKRLDPDWLKRMVSLEIDEAIRRRKAYLGELNQPRLRGKTAIVVDDGVATGLTLQAAIKDLRRRQAGRIVIAVPVAPAEIALSLEAVVDEFMALDRPSLYLGGVGAYYAQFDQVSDKEVIDLIKTRR